jgi:hypothetical protein
MIGEMVEFKDYCDEIFTAKVVGVFSDKFDNVKFFQHGIVNVPYYWSKKTKSYRSVKEKDLESVYLEVESSRGKTDYILLKESLS